MENIIPNTSHFTRKIIHTISNTNYNLYGRQLFLKQGKPEYIESIHLLGEYFMDNLY